jgi:hypothetical protein
MLSAKATLLLIFLIGLLLQVYLLSRVWIDGDQVALLTSGLDFANHGTIHPTAKTMSGGGAIPGCLLQLLVGIPLKIYPHFRAPNFLISIMHVCAFFVLCCTFRRSLGFRFVTCFAAIYWLSPWRCFHGALLWEPSYMYLPAALHCWACWCLRSRARALPSFVLGTVLTASFQLHGSFLVLVIASALLVSWRKIRIRAAAALGGLCFGAITLIPTAIEIANHSLPSITPVGETSFIGYGFVKCYPVLKSLGYWVRFSSLDVGRILSGPKYFWDDWGDDVVNYGNLEIAVQLLHLAGVVSIVFCAFCTYRYLAQLKGKHTENRDEDDIWFRQYCLVSLVAMLVSAGLSPVTIQSWHVSVILHAACVPVAYWMSQHWPSARSLATVLILAFVALRIPTVGFIGSEHRFYRIIFTQKNKVGENQTPVSEELLNLIPDRIRYPSGE